VVGRGNVAVIDPGPDDPAHLDALREALEGETVTTSSSPTRTAIIRRGAGP
jgi:hypothetical protein